VSRSAFAGARRGKAEQQWSNDLEHYALFSDDDESVASELSEAPPSRGGQSLATAEGGDTDWTKPARPLWDGKCCIGSEARSE